jgi:hypothetical protein
MRLTGAARANAINSVSYCFPTGSKSFGVGQSKPYSAIAPDRVVGEVIVEIDFREDQRLSEASGPLGIRSGQADKS